MRISYQGTWMRKLSPRKRPREEIVVAVYTITKTILFRNCGTRFKRRREKED